MHHPAVGLLLALALLTFPAAAAPTPLEFTSSLHEGDVEGVGNVTGMKFMGVDGSASLTFRSADLEQAWDNLTVQTDQVAGGNAKERSQATLAGENLLLTTNQHDAILMVFGSPGTDWRTVAGLGRLAAPEPGQTDLTDTVPLDRSGGELQVPLERSSLWRPEGADVTTVRGDFWISLYGWTGVGDQGTSFRTGHYDETEVAGVRVEKSSAAWIHVRGGTLTLGVDDSTVRDVFVHAPTITTDGTTTLTGLPTAAERVYEGVTTLTVTGSDDRLEGVVTEGRAATPNPALTALTSPEGAAWLWGGAGAVLFVAAFVFVALATRSVPVLEWRAYRALDRHRPLVAAFWANFWTRRDPWDGHAWSARGEARMLMGRDLGAARDFTKAHNLLPPDERAINALHAARCHARAGHASRTAHWIGIVASLDLNVLLTAREEPDFASVWDHASVQQAVRHVLGAEA